MEYEVTRYDEPRPIDIALPPPANGLRAVAFSRSAVAEMTTHACAETQHEVGGYILGFPAVCSRTGMQVTWVERAVRAVYESTSTRVVMKASSAVEVERVRAEKNTLLVGWYHSHPGLGIFLSETDVRNFRDYHPEVYQLAIVVDPLRVDLAESRPANEWFGVFVWSPQGRPVRVDCGDLQLLESPPTLAIAEDSK